MTIGKAIVVEVAVGQDIHAKCQEITGPYTRRIDSAKVAKMKRTVNGTVNYRFDCPAVDPRENDDENCREYNCRDNLKPFVHETPHSCKNGR
jgi:hypothetical protein